MNGRGARYDIPSWATLAVQRYEIKAIIPKGRSPLRGHRAELTDAITRRKMGGKTNAKKVEGRNLTDVVHPRTVLTSLRPLFLRLCLRSRGRLVAALSSPCQIPHCQAPRSPQTHVRICPDARTSPGRHTIRSVTPACPVHSFLAVSFAPVRRWPVDAAVAAAAQ
jgi:hypothetical protein